MDEFTTTEAGSKHKLYYMLFIVKSLEKSSCFSAIYLQATDNVCQTYLLKAFLIAFHLEMFYSKAEIFFVVTFDMVSLLDLLLLCTTCFILNSGWDVFDK